MADHEPGSDDGGWLLAGASDPDDIASYYDRWAERYDAELESWAYDAPTVAAGHLHERVRADGALIDAGCGTGLVGRALRAVGHTGRLVGVDISEASLRLAEASGAYDEVGLGDLQQGLGFDDDSFEGLVCVGVMTYLPDVERCWRDLARVVRPGGVVVVTQRDDMWIERACRAVVERLADDGVWRPRWVSDSSVYLPGNADFGDEIGVRYVVAEVV